MEQDEEEEKPNIITRLFYFALFAIFSFAPVYIVIGFFINVFKSGESFSVSSIESIDFTGIAIVFGILIFCVFLSYFLWVLAWRSLTWKSGRTDGKLLPPQMMKMCIAIIGSLGFLMIIYAIFKGEYAYIFGGIYSVGMAIYASKKSNA